MKNVDELKYQADLAFARKNYFTANEHYTEILSMSSLSSKKTVGPLLRDVSDANLRCLIQLGRDGEAFEIIKNLFVKTNPANLEHMSNCLDMLIIVFKHQKKFAKLAAAQISLIKIHPQMPKLWNQLGDTMDLLEYGEVSNLCKEQSSKLYCASEKSLPESFIKELNSGSFTDLGSSKLRQTKETEIIRRGQHIQPQHPPGWFLDEDRGDIVNEYIQNFITSELNSPLSA